MLQYWPLQIEIFDFGRWLGADRHERVDDEHRAGGQHPVSGGGGSSGSSALLAVIKVSLTCLLEMKAPVLKLHDLQHLIQWSLIQHIDTTCKKAYRLL